MGLVDSIFRHAGATPQRTAVVYNGRPLSYAGFAGRIAGARAFLSRQGLEPGQLAVLCLAHLLDTWIIALALRSLGLITVHARSVRGVAAFGPGPLLLVSTDAEAWTGLDEAAAYGRLLMVPGAAYAEGAAAAQAPPPTAPFGAHILLTSGTTGVYKKVLVTPECDAWNQALRADLYGFSPASVANVFDFGGWTAVGYHLPSCLWTLGAGVVLHQDMARWLGLGAPGLTLAYTHPQVLAELLAAPPGAYPRNDAMTLIVTSGALSVEQWRAAREQLTNDVRTCIGATETGVVTITRIETPDDLAWHRIHPACAVEVVDEHDRPLPTGAEGAVRIRTHGVDGYLGDPQTSRAFFRDGWFHTGDLGVIRDDGRLSLQGRVTNVINVMGDKLAAGPIERQLEAALGAVGVCVYSAPGPDGEEVHVAVQAARRIALDALRTALGLALPGVASVRVHAVTDFPRNQTGKIDRAALKTRLSDAPPA
jgi:acyl-coenzyme A synthetase/AMP-(fatty) acid ligase